MPIEQPILLDVPDQFSSARLLLRLPRVGEGARINAAVVESVAELAPWMPWATPTPAPQDTELWVRRTIGRFVNREMMHFALFLRGDGEDSGDGEDDVTGDATCVGGCGMHRMDWNVGMAEIGYWLRTPYVGKGYMTEAVNAMTAFAFDVLKMQRLEIRCDERNRRSGAVAERAGYDLEGLLRRDARDPKGELRNTLVYAKLAPGA